MLLGLVVFVAIYALLAVPRLGRVLRERATARWGRAGALAFSRPGLALAGAILVVVLLQVTPREAFRAIDFRTLALLLGMMLILAALDAANAFAVLADRLARALPSPRRLLIGTMLFVALLSAFVLNDAVVLLFTPVLVRAAAAMRVSPIPFLVGEAIAANLGSAATPTGNPQNAAIATARGLDFVAFSEPLVPLALLALVLGIAVCAFAFRRDLATTGPTVPRGERVAFSSRRMLALALASLLLALAGFLFGPRFGLPLWLSALGAGLAVIVFAPVARASPARIAKRVDVGILVFFIGLFVLLESVRASGVLTWLHGSFTGSGGFVVVTAILSNVVSNVPAVLLLLPTVASDGQALLLAATSTFAGNATFLGSAATVIVAETARREGADFSILRFTLVGLPIAVVTVGLAWLMLG